MPHPLPIDAVLPDIVEAVRRWGRLVIEAPPGAGKTTRVPLALLDVVPGRIVLLEPRRLAARAAAERMAETLGEPAGRTVGYRMRGATKVSRDTRIEVVTEGILTRMIQADPDLPGIGAVLFDEFHERSLNADLGLALCLEVRAALRPDLRLVAMSATLDGAAVASLMDARAVRAEGRAHPVETRWLDRPPDRSVRLETRVAEAVQRALEETAGGILVFLPGAGEIRRTEAVLRARLPEGVVLRPLYGALSFAAQRAAVAPSAGARKVVLATSIAETSLTIEDVRVVIDAGLSRRSRFDPGSGMARLVTERAARAEADQRRGRAGRVAPGVCHRLWSASEEGAMAAFAPPEIETADLSRLVLDLAGWGVRDPGALRFLTPPPPGPFAAAREVLRDLDAVDSDGAITGHGRAMADVPLHPRLAHMVVCAGAAAAPLAALLSESDPAPGSGVDLASRLRAVAGAPGDPAYAPIRAEARRLARHLPSGPPLTTAQMAALAFPDRIGLRRPGDLPRWLLSGGKGATMDPIESLSGERLIVVTETDGHPVEARIRGALAISEAELRDVSGARIRWVETCTWSRREGRVVARRQERLGAIVLDDRPWNDAPPEAATQALLEGMRDLGLPWTPTARRFADRVDFLRQTGATVPEMSDEALLADLDTWLPPYLQGLRSAEDLRRVDLAAALRGRLSRDQRQIVDRNAPAEFLTPLGRKVAIDYAGGIPTIAVRLQEMFGCQAHPVATGRPLRVTLLSPGGRPIQVTTDLPGFWATSYAEVRKEMRGRYPKHPWPEDPARAVPTLRAKPRR